MRDGFGEGGAAPMARGAAPHRGLPLRLAHEGREQLVRAGNDGHLGEMQGRR
jgi:hypothetical protein